MPQIALAAPRRTVIATAITTVVAAFVLVLTRPGIGWPVVAIGVAAAGTVSAWRTRPAESPARRLERHAWAIGSIAFIAIGTIRADALLFTWCVIAALACASVCLAGGRTFRGLAAGVVGLTISVGRGLPWWTRGAVQTRRSRTAVVRLGWTVGASVGLLLVFGTLFATADAEFAHVLVAITPTWSGWEIWRAISVVVLAGPLIVGIAYVAGDRTPVDAVAPKPARLVRRAEWTVPLMTLDLLFLAFVLVQLETLFGVRDRVLRTAGLTYAQYARSGFWQLLVVAALTLVVIAVAVRVAPRAEPRDRLLLRLLLGTLATLTLVIVASALQRLVAYDNAYGYTRLRLAVGVAEIWLGLVFVLVIGAGVRLTAAWLPRVVAGTAAIALLATAIVGPDEFVADRDVARFERTGQIDLVYLSTLSPDAVPALDRLPSPQRTCVLLPIHWRLTDGDDWRSWNLARSRARAVLASALDVPPLRPGVPCDTF